MLRCWDQDFTRARSGLSNKVAESTVRVRIIPRVGIVEPISSFNPVVDKIVTGGSICFCEANAVCHLGYTIRVPHLSVNDIPVNLIVIAAPGSRCDKYSGRRCGNPVV